MGQRPLPSGQLTRYSGNPLVRNGPQSYDLGKTGPRAIVRMAPGDYRMWYEAVAQGNPGDLTQVGYATSHNGLTWTKRGIVMSPGGSSSWEKDEVSPNTVLYENGVFKMWYHGGGFFSSSGIRSGLGRIGYATSSDGLNWTKYSGNPVLDVGGPAAFDELQAAEPRVFHLRSIGYRMYYTGQNSSKRGALGMATSSDGISWTKYGGNPVITSADWGGWGGAFIPRYGRWNLWHATADAQSGLLYKSSSDGISWTPGPNGVVLAPSGLDTADRIAVGDSVSGYFEPSNNTYRIMYTGFSWDFRGTGRLEAVCLATIAQP